MFIDHPIWALALHALAYLLAALAVAPCCYLAVLTGSALIARRRDRTSKHPSVPALGHLAFVIPAHNEEADIRATLEGLVVEADEDTSVHVVADNCTDNTAAVVRSFNSTAHSAVQLWERHDPTKKAKGYALEWALPRVFAWSDERAHPLAFVCIVDADATLSRGSVKLAREHFAEGHAVLQSAYIFGDGRGLRPQIMRIAAATFIARGLGRGLLGLSDTLRGNGMWFRRGVLEQTPWCAHSLAEDLEYTMLLLRAGHVVHLLSGSAIVGKLATTKEGEAQQRMRWEGGRWAVVKDHTGRLLGEMLRRPSLHTFDLLMELLIPPMGLLVSLQALALLALLFLPGHAWVVVLFGWLLLGLVVMLSVPIAGLPPRLLGALLYVPIYVAWKLLLLPRTLAASRSKRWVRTAR